MNTPTRPALRYYGGKWKLAPWIISYFPEHRIYTEAYGGAASVLLRKARSYAEVYNDLDAEVVNLFRVLRNPSQARELLRLVTLTPYAREEFDGSYLGAGDPIEQARHTLVRSFMGFGSNGVQYYRTSFRNNTTRRGTTPAHDWANLPDALERIVERLRGVTIESRPAVQVLTDHDGANTLHYVDPPYPHSVRSIGADKQPHVYAHEMTDDDHRELSSVLHGVVGMVVVSGYACELYDHDLYPDWQRVTRQTNADGARARTEVLWISPNTVVQPRLL